MAKKSKKSKVIEQEVIWPDGHSSQSWMDKLSAGTLADTLYLVVWVIAVVIGLILLADIAIGLLLILLGSAGINNWLIKHKR